MPTLGLRHTPEDPRSFRIAFTRRHRLVHGARFNLPPPRGQEAGDWFLGAPPISPIHHTCPLAARPSSGRLIGRCRRASSAMRSTPSISPEFPLAFRLIFSVHLQTLSLRHADGTKIQRKVDGAEGPAELSV